MGRPASRRSSGPSAPREPRPELGIRRLSGSPKHLFALLLSVSNYNVTMSASRPTAVAERQLPASEAASDEVLATRLRVAVTRLNRRLRQQSLAGLSPAQASALGTVNRLDGLTLGELAAAEQVQPPTATRLVTSLEGAGLVARETDETDRRVVRVRITTEGRRTLQRIRTLKNAYLTRRLAALDPAEHELAEALTSLLEHLVADG
jgi:DNA-binding MarR family transcriptional regulator